MNFRTLKKGHNKENKKRAKAGFTIAEMIAATLILAIIALVLAGSIPVVTKSYTTMVLKNEALTIISYVTRLTSDELRYAKDVTIEADGVRYSNSVYGDDAKLTTKNIDAMGEDGFLAVVINPDDPGTREPNELLNRKAYTKGLGVHLSPVSYTDTDGVVTVKIIVYNKTIVDSSPAENPETAAVFTIEELKVRTLNPNP